MPAQDVAGEVERAADQHVVAARGRGSRWPRQWRPRPRRHCWPGRRAGAAAAADACGIAAQRLARHRHEAQARRQRQQRVRNCARSLVVSMPTTRCSARPRASSARLSASTSAGGGVVAAIEPDPGARRHQRRQPARLQPLQPGRPAALAKPRPMAAASRPVSSSCSAAMAASPAFSIWCVPGSARARQRRGWRLAVSTADPSAVGTARQSRPCSSKRRPDLGGARLDHRQRLGLLRPDHRRHARLQDARPSRTRSWPACRRDSSHGPSTPARSGTGAVGRRRWSRPAGRPVRSPAAPSPPERSAKARKAAAVVISKKVIGAPALAASQRSRQAASRSSAIGAPSMQDALVEADQMGRDVAVDPPAAGPAASPPASPACCPCRWCRRYGPPAAGGARGGPRPPAAARPGRARDRCSWGAARAGGRGSGHSRGSPCPASAGASGWAARPVPRPGPAAPRG